MKWLRGSRLVVAAGLFGAFAGCLLQADGSGTPCESDLDCPVFFVCTETGEGQKTCEPEGFVADAGSTGTLHYWCKDVAPVVETHCTGACHGEQTIGSGNTSFRLDQYSNVGMQKGAFEMAARIKDRAFVQESMPPGVGAMTAEERALLAAWVDQGAPWCDDGSSPPVLTPDSGTTETDAGTEPMDAGTTPMDAGTTPMDAGTPVSFATDVQPILAMRCAGCHDSGGNNLSTASSSYTSLVSQPSGCNAAVDRVAPGDVQNSMMWRKIANTADKCGTQMPQNGALKDTQPAEFQLIEQWIAQGAKNN